MTIWVPGEGDQGMAGVTIAARDTLRWHYIPHMSNIITWSHSSKCELSCLQAEGEPHQAAGVFRDT